MNFLSHFYIDQDDEDSHFVLGLILPDLCRIFNKKWRVTNSKAELNSDSCQSIHRGIQRHLVGDQYFHDSKLFLTSMESIKQSLLSQGFMQGHKYQHFVAHVMVELILDRVIVKKHPGVPKKFYEHLSNVIDNELIVNLNSFNFVYDGKEFLSFFQNFVKHRYIFEYQYNERMIYALNRIYSRLVKQDFSPKDRTILNSLIDEYDDSFSKRYLQFFSDLKMEMV